MTPSQAALSRSHISNAALLRLVQPVGQLCLMQLRILFFFFFFLAALTVVIDAVWAGSLLKITDTQFINTNVED